MRKLIISIITISFVFGQNPVFQQFSTLFADIVENVNQSVVTITASKTYATNKDIQDFYRFWGRGRRQGGGLSESAYADSAGWCPDPIGPCSPCGVAANAKGFAACRRPPTCRSLLAVLGMP